MTDYKLQWVTDQLAIGHAPMFKESLTYVRDQGVDTIINLCGEYCDLHEIERDFGFEVYYLPVRDENAPDKEAVDRALEWLSDRLGRGFKVLVHCRFGKGRTGTFVTSHLVREGLSVRQAERIMKGHHCLPTNRSQWKFVKNYEKACRELISPE